MKQKKIIEIYQVDNGYIVKDFINDIVTAYAFKDEKDVQKQQELLYHIIGIFEFNINTKWDKEKLNIGIEHGSHYDCKDKKCEICK